MAWVPINANEKEKGIVYCCMESFIKVRGYNFRTGQTLRKKACKDWGIIWGSEYIFLIIILHIKFEHAKKLKVWFERLVYELWIIKKWTNQYFILNNEPINRFFNNITRPIIFVCHFFIFYTTLCRSPNIKCMHNLD